MKVVDRCVIIRPIQCSEDTSHQGHMVMGVTAVQRFHAPQKGADQVIHITQHDQLQFIV